MATNLAAGVGNRPDVRIKVLVIDTQPIVRYGICQLVNGQWDMEILAATPDCTTAWEHLGNSRPDVLVVDVQIRDRQAHKLIEKVAEQQLPTRILVYSSQFAELQVLEAIRSGAHGYITKDAEPDRLCDAIRAVAKGGSYLDSSLAGVVIGQLGRKHERRDMNRRQLTQRESVVLQALADGKRNKEIATQMAITERTVKYHITSVFQKMRVRSRTEAVRLAVEKGII